MDEKTEKKHHSERMSTLVRTFVAGVTDLTRDMARASLVRLFDEQQVPGSVIIPEGVSVVATKRYKRMQRAVKKIAKKTAKQHVKHVEKDVKKRKNESRKAWRLRERQRAGKKLEDHEMAWLAEYVAKTTRSARG